MTPLLLTIMPLEQLLKTLGGAIFLRNAHLLDLLPARGKPDQISERFAIPRRSSAGHGRVLIRPARSVQRAADALVVAQEASRDSATAAANAGSTRAFAVPVRTRRLSGHGTRQEFARRGVGRPVAHFHREQVARRAGGGTPVRSW